VLWFTGLSGSGKTTIASRIACTLGERGARVTMLDGDTVREQFKVQLGFSREDIRENNRRIAELAKEESARFNVVIVSIISPYAEDRTMARSIIGKGFVEVFINASLEACMARDTKGLYGRAQRGEMDNLIGFSPSNPYEAPINPDIEIKTDELSIEQAIIQIINSLPN